MEIPELKRVIRDQELEKVKIMESGNIIPRDVPFEWLEKQLSIPNALVLLGMRRCGKSVLSWLLMEGKSYAYINFDDEALFGMTAADLDSVLGAFYELYGEPDYMVFDEIQNIPGWELFINRLRRTKKVIITGSNSQMLSGELASKLTGRHSDFILQPFSFREFCRFRKADIKPDYATATASRAQSLLEEYLSLGGLPETYSLGPSAALTQSPATPFWTTVTALL
jgi:uncharacterized protein